MVKSIASEYTRRKEVERMGEGKIGYVHLRAMGRGDLLRWYREFCPVHHRQGLIIDMHGNIETLWSN